MEKRVSRQITKIQKEDFFEIIKTLEGRPVTLKETGIGFITNGKEKSERMIFQKPRK
jgi:hypothetical protein